MDSSISEIEKIVKKLDEIGKSEAKVEDLIPTHKRALYNLLFKIRIYSEEIVKEKIAAYVNNKFNRYLDTIKTATNIINTQFQRTFDSEKEKNVYMANAKRLFDHYLKERNYILAKKIELETKLKRLWY